MYVDEPACRFAPMPTSLRSCSPSRGLFNLLFFVYPVPRIAAATRRPNRFFE